MTDEVTPYAEPEAPDAPVGYPLAGHEPGKPGQEPPDYVGIEEHGKPEFDGVAAARVMTSAVWGAIAARVTSEHGMACDYCGVDWPTSVCMPAHTHPGVDIAIVRGTPLYAAEGGTVEFAGWARFYRPHHVDIRTAGGELQIYGHMWSVDPAVRRGGQVQAGQYLGTSGEQTKVDTMIPDGTGAHLHFERRVGTGCAADPAATLERDGPVLPCRPDAPPEFDGTEKRVNNVVFHPERRTVRSETDGLNVRRFATANACQTREPLNSGETIKVLYWIRGQAVDGENRWWVAVDGSRIWTGGTVEKPQGG